MTASLRLLALCTGAALTAASCGGGGGSGGVGGRIAVSGSSTVEPISSRVASKFAAVNGGVEISVDGPGTGDGFELFCNGEIDIADASRPIEPEEIEACEGKGIEFIELKVAIDGLSVITSADNDEIDCLGFEDLYALLGIESQGFDQWSDADDLGRELDASHVPYPDVPLVVTAPGEESGTFDSFAELVLEDIAYEKRNVPEDSPVVRPDYQASANDSVIIEGVAGTPTSLGWVGYAFYDNNQDKVKAIPIESESGECVAPTPDTIRSGEYPIARDLYIYVDKQEAAENGAVAAFVDFYLSGDGLASVGEAGYVALDDAGLEKTRATWQDGKSGANR